MRRPSGNYGGDSGGGGVYGGGGAQLHQNSKSGYHQGRHQEQQPLRDKDEAQHNNQWRWEGDGPEAKLLQTAMSPTAPFSEGQVREAPRSYYQSLDPQMPLSSQDGGAPRSQSHEADMDIGYEDSRVPLTLEGLEQRFMDDIMKLSKEQTDAEDAENARHRERIHAINAKYEEQLFALRSRHASQRDEFLQRESRARHQQYQQIVTNQYPSSGTDPRGNNAGSAGEPHRSYNSYRERGRYPGNARDHGYEPKVPYPRGRPYDTASRYY